MHEDMFLKTWNDTSVKASSGSPSSEHSPVAVTVGLKSGLYISVQQSSDFGWLPLNFNSIAIIAEPLTQNFGFFKFHTT